MRTPAFLRYGLVGAAGTLAHYLIMVALVSAAAIGPVAASSAGAAAGAVINYLLNYRFTFASTQRHARAAPRFFVVAVAGFFLNGFAMALFTAGLGINYLLAQLGATALVLIFGFCANSAWSFSSKS